MSLSLLVAEFLEYLEIEKGCSPLTIRRYRHYLDRFYNWLSENYSTAKPDEIDAEVVRRYRLYLAHFKDPSGAQLKRITQSYYIIALRAFLRYLVVKRDIATLSPEKIELPKQGSRSVSFLDSGQMERLLNSPKISDNIGLRDKAILETLFSTGLRVSELVSLNRDQIGFDRQEFGIKGKGNKVRVVFLSDTAAEWIKRYLQSRRDSAAAIRVLPDRHRRKNAADGKVCPKDCHEICQKVWLASQNNPTYFETLLRHRSAYSRC